MQGTVSFLALIACGALGVLSARRVSRRLDTAEQWDAALRRMESAAAQGRTLPDILRAGAESGAACLDVGAKLLEDTPALSPDAWLARLPWDGLLLPREQAILSACLSALFSPSRDEQTLFLRTAQSQWQEVVRACRQAQQTKARLYRQLGWLGGAALFILTL